DDSSQSDVLEQELLRYAESVESVKKYDRKAPPRQMNTRSLLIRGPTLDGFIRKYDPVSKVISYENDPEHLSSTLSQIKYPMINGDELVIKQISRKPDLSAALNSTFQLKGTFIDDEYNTMHVFTT